MSPHNEKLRQEVLALQPALIQSADRLTQDANEAHNLVHLTMVEAFAICDAEGEVRGDPRLWVFGLLRSTFHSVARRRAVRQERGHQAVQRQLDRDAALAAHA